MAAGIADRGGEDAFAQLPEFALRTPETTEPEHGLLETFGIWRLQLRGR